MIVTENLGKSYSCAGRELRALDAVSLRIRPGELVCITGSSGSGKTTLAGLLGCLQRPSRGSYFLDGTDVGALTAKARARIRLETIGFVFQNFQLMPQLSAVRNVELPLVYLGLPPRLRRERAREALDAVGLLNRAEHLPWQLSGGQMQRVALARAVVAGPRLILADEPTGNLDPSTGAEIISLLFRLNSAGCTVVIITHDRDIAARAPRSITIESGRILD